MARAALLRTQRSPLSVPLDKGVIRLPLFTGRDGLIHAPVSTDELRALFALTRVRSDESTVPVIIAVCPGACLV